MKKVVTVLFAVSMAAVLIAVCGCGGGDGEASNTPSEVAAAYMEASLNMDVDGAYELMSEADREMLTKEDMEASVEQMSQSMEGFDYSYEIGEETIDGDDATVAVKLIIGNEATGESEEMEQELNLVKEGGEWKIDLGLTGAME